MVGVFDRENMFVLIGKGLWNFIRVMFMLYVVWIVGVMMKL